MNIYQLPDKSFISLDAILSVGTVIQHYDDCSCEIQFALQKDTTEVWLAGCDSFELSGAAKVSMIKGMVKRAETERMKLIEAWKEVKK